MTFDWQSIVVLISVAAAVAYLARATWQSIARRKAAACAGGCGSCPAGAANVKPNVVEIGSLAADSKER